jgi:hypothetical protein
MEVAVTALHRAMRLAEGLMRSPETTVGKQDVPADTDRDLLRLMRNAIDHNNQPIIEGRAGKGQTLALWVGSDDSTIDDASGTQTVTHAQLGQWGTGAPRAGRRPD